MDGRRGEGQRACETRGRGGLETVARNPDRGRSDRSPGDAPRKRYLYTSLRFFLGISIVTECCLSTTTARLEGVNRPCEEAERERRGQAAFGVAARRTRRPETSRRAGTGARGFARDADGGGLSRNTVTGVCSVGQRAYLGDVRT